MKVLLRVFHYPCSNLLLNIAIQVSLSNLKYSSSIVSCLNFTHQLGSGLSRGYACKSKNKLEAPWRILFFGTDEFAVKSLQSLSAKYQTQTLISKLEVVSSALGKFSPVIQFAKQEGLKLHHWPIKPDVIHDNYDIGMVVSFGHLIPSKIMDAFPLGMINVHGSILPRWRGAAPIVHAVLQGDHETGISIIRIRPKHFDRGEIVRQYRCSISPDDTAKELHDKLAEVGGQLLIECVRDLPKCVQKAVPQTEEGATYANKIDANYSIIDWKTMSSKKVYNLHRALGHIYPLLAQWNGVNVKLHDLYLDSKDKIHISEQGFQNLEQKLKSQQNDSSKVSSALSFLSGSTVEHLNTVNVDNLDFTPGTVVFDKPNKVLRIKCIDGNYILCPSITVAGKKKMTAVDFHNGFIGKVKNPADAKFINVETRFLSSKKK